MTESLMGFTLGFAVVLIAVSVWKALGWAREQARKLQGVAEVAATNATAIVDLWKYADANQRQIVEVRSMRSEAGASDAAIAQLAGRLSKLENTLTEQQLTILDTAERVAHKLQDRQRKRDNVRELDTDEDVPTDPNLLLARARQFYGAAPRDEGQMQLDGIAQ